MEIIDQRDLTTRGNQSVTIQCRHVSKEFTSRQNAQSVQALDGIDLVIGSGEFVVLLGPSGCGKSTLLSLIAGFQTATQGEILHNGNTVHGPNRHRTVVFQDYALFPWLTLIDNVAFGLKAQGMGKAERHAAARELLQMVKLGGFELRYPHEVSGGMKQRAALARALATKPDILLMDEPLGALDPQTRILMQEEIARITEQANTSVVLVTHSIEEGVFLGDKVVLMSARPGRVKAVYAVDLPRPRTSETRKMPEFPLICEQLWDVIRPEWQES